MRDKDPIVAALMFSSKMTIDLVCALGWCTALDGDALKEFRKQLDERRKANPVLDACAKDTGT